MDKNLEVVIREYMKREKMNIKGLAQEVGMKQNTLGRKIKGSREFLPGEIRAVCERLKIPRHLVIYPEDIQPFNPPQPIITVLGIEDDALPGIKTEDYLAVPLVEGQIAAGFAGAVPGDYVKGLVWVYRPEIGKRQYHNLRAVQLANNAHSMEPTIRSGDIVIIDPADREINPKSIYAVRLDEEGGCAIKRVRVSNDFAVLLSDNADFEPIILPKDRAENLIIGRVIWSWTSWVR